MVRELPAMTEDEQLRYDLAKLDRRAAEEEDTCDSGTVGCIHLHVGPHDVCETR